LQDFGFAGAVANVPPQLGAVFSQLRIILSQLLSGLVHFLARSADIFEVLANFRLVVMTAVVNAAVMTAVIVRRATAMIVPSAIAMEVALVVSGVRRA